MAAHRAMLVASMLVFFDLSGTSAQAEEYQLGPLDQLDIRVADLRAGTGEAHQWSAFDGGFTISASGKVSLPLLGELDASEKTTAELADAIALKLQSKVGLAQKPDASVQISKYRPFYVMGGVDKPGEYEYRPDMSVLQAVGLAGGLARLTGDALLGFARDALSTRGDLRLVSVDRLGLLARQARLDAEIKGVETIVFPSEVQARVGESDVARLVREEQLLFESRRYALQSQLATLKQTKVLLEKQIESLNAKDASLGHQLDINKKELEQVNGLVSKGLAILPRALAIEQNTAQFESDRLDVQLAILRAQQDAAKADRDALELTNTQRNEALQEATEVRTKLAEAAEKMETAQSLIYQAEVRAPQALSVESGAVTTPDYYLTRRIGDKTETRKVQEADIVKPGDVVRVEPKAKGAGSVSTGSAETPVPASVSYN